jgi:hypothetical protein
MHARFIDGIVGAVCLSLTLAPAEPAAQETESLARELLSNAAATRRADCARQLGELGAAANPVSRALCRAMLDHSKAVRLAAGEALEKVNPGLYWPVRTLVAGEDRPNHAKAIAALAKIAKDAGPALPILIYRLRSDLSAGRIVTLRWQLSQLAERARRDPSLTRQRDSVEQALQKAQAQLDESLAGLPVGEGAQAVEDVQKVLAPTIVAALGALPLVAGDDPSVVKELARTLETNDSQVQLAAFRALAVIGRNAIGQRGLILHYVQPYLKNRSEKVRLETIYVLVALDQEARSAKLSLQILRNKDASLAVRRAAAEALNNMDDD